MPKNGRWTSKRHEVRYSPCVARARRDRWGKRENPGKMPLRHLSEGGFKACYVELQAIKLLCPNIPIQTGLNFFLPLVCCDIISSDLIPTKQLLVSSSANTGSRTRASSLHQETINSDLVDRHHWHNRVSSLLLKPALSTFLVYHSVWQNLLVLLNSRRYIIDVLSSVGQIFCTEHRTNSVEIAMLQ